MKLQFIRAYDNKTEVLIPITSISFLKVVDPVAHRYEVYLNSASISPNNGPLFTNLPPAHYDAFGIVQS